MFNKLLIANRGEIACRIIATAQRLGVQTLAVYSDADAGAKHVALADEAVRIGPAEAAESYLRGEIIVDVARRFGADAVHPGYGFLSENPEFAEAVAAAGAVFVGPPPSAIRAMGLKDAAKALMQEAGVPVAPGYHGEEQDPAFLAEQAARIGYPVLIKARAGGGGKGMRRVDDPAAFADALASAQREAAAAFGDPACLVEKYILSPRHVEVQVFADGAGNVTHLFERDCSLQRRHQKVIEEAPAPGITAEVRDAMGKAAVEAARAIGYRGAGTVEFIADGSEGLRPDGFWFMEMNTRLQVEHPVTEAITGLDLVELQLRVAAGESLPFRQDELTISGHAVEARLYAEDPAAGFLPSTGQLPHLRLPRGSAFAHGSVRIDSGVRQGDAVSRHYDPMIAKLIAHGPTRADAISRLKGALAAVEVVGPATNRDFLLRLLASEEMASGAVDTGVIERRGEQLTAMPAPDNAVIAAAMLAERGFLDAPSVHAADPWDALRDFRSWGPAAAAASLSYSGQTLHRRIMAMGSGRFQVDAFQIEVEPIGEDAWELRTEGATTAVRIAIGPERVSVFTAETSYVFTRIDPLEGGLETEGAAADVALAPMPGLVRAVHVVAGQTIAKGAPLLVLEAMKMEHTLAAQRDGIVAELLVAEGDQVEDGAMLVRLEPEGEA